MAQATSYYVRFTVEQDSNPRFAGPFNTADEAQAAIDTALQAADSAAVMQNDTTGGESANIRIDGVLSHAEALHAGLGTQTPPANVVGPIVPTNLDDLSDLQMMPY